MAITENKTGKTNKILYWIFTALIAVFVLPGAFFINSPQAQQGMAHLSIPAWLHYEAGIAQPMAALVILLPFFGACLKEWAYIGLGIVYISAFIAHLYVDGLAGMSFAPLVMFAVLAGSYICYHRLPAK